MGTQPATLAKAGTARQINIYNPNDQPIFLGLGAASTDTGFPVQAGGYASLDWSSEMDLVAVAVDDLPIAVRVLEVDAFGNA